MPPLKQMARLLGDANKLQPINWYPGHMFSGLKAVKGKLATVDCVIEVHDARIPLVGRNEEFRRSLGGVKPHLLVLNKKDLADLSKWDEVHARLKDQGDQTVILTDLSGHISANPNRGYNKILDHALRAINSSDRHNRATAENFTVMIVGIPNVGKSTLINRLCQLHLGVKGEKAKTGKTPGVTRHVDNKIKLCSRPLIYCLDTPGILPPPKMRTRTQALQLAACATISNVALDNSEVASFLLSHLNRADNPVYTFHYGLEKTVESVSELYKCAISEDARARGSNFSLRINHKNCPDLDGFCRIFLEDFRQGRLGLVMFD